MILVARIHFYQKLKLNGVLNLKVTFVKHVGDKHLNLIICHMPSQKPLNFMQISFDKTSAGLEGLSYHWLAGAGVRAPAV